MQHFSFCLVKSVATSDLLTKTLTACTWNASTKKVLALIAKQYDTQNYTKTDWILESVESEYNGSVF